MSTITTINASDLITNSRSDINNNFSNLNTDKIETSYLDTDSTMAANSDSKIATQKATKSYINTFTANILPVSAIINYGSVTPPTNWLLCDGSAVSRTTYSTLFGIIGTTYGSGNGSTTFNLPYLLFPLTTGLVSYWKFDELSGNAYDSYGTNHLTNNNTTAYASGIFGNGIDFESGSSNSMSIADNSTLSITGDLSLSFWYKPESFVANHYLISKSTPTGNQRSYLLYLVQATSKINAVLSSNGTATVEDGVSLGTFSNGTWYHFVVVYTAAAGTVDFYKNGASLGQKSGFPTSLYDSTSIFRIGADNDLTTFADGVMDEVAIWSRALTSANVTTLYNSGSAIRFVSPTSNGASNVFPIIKY